MNPQKMSNYLLMTDVIMPEMNCHFDSVVMAALIDINNEFGCIFELWSACPAGPFANSFSTL